MVATNSNADQEVLDHVDVYTDSDAIDPDVYIVSSGLDSFGPMAVQTDLLLGSEYAESVIAFNPIQMAAEGQTDYINSIRLDCTIDGDACTLLLPPEHIDKIFIDDQNRLWNMSTSTITGRIVDDQFNPYQTEGKLVYLTACLGNNFSSIYNYGSPNYVREYYWSSSRLTYDDTYCEIIVDQYHYPFFASEGHW